MVAATTKAFLAHQGLDRSVLEVGSRFPLRSDRCFAAAIFCPDSQATASTDPLDRTARMSDRRVLRRSECLLGSAPLLRTQAGSVRLGSRCVTWVCLFQGWTPQIGFGLFVCFHLKPQIKRGTNSQKKDRPKWNALGVGDMAPVRVDGKSTSCSTWISVVCWVSFISTGAGFVQPQYGSESV